MENYKYFKNEKCEYFPCHKLCGDFFNCIFCYCPLYSMGDKCGGNFVYTEEGIKDCSKCSLVHSRQGYDHVIKMLKNKLDDDKDELPKKLDFDALLR